MRSELDTLKAELSSAQKQAAQREREPPRRSRRGLAIAAGAATLGAGVVAGVLISDQGGHARQAAPISSVPPPRPTPTTGPPTTPPPTSPSAGSLAAPPSTTQPTTSQSTPVEPAAAQPTIAQPTIAQPAGLIMAEPGQSFWTIAQAAETQLVGRTPSDREVARYWLALIAANRSRLVRPGDPNLLYVGQALLLPPM